MASKSKKRRKRRKRSADSSVAGTTPAPEPRREPTQAARKRRSAGLDERPPAPWGSFPLIELSVLVGLVMLVLGFFFVEGERSAILIGTGLLLASISGFELAIREHFAGYRSHTLLLAAVPAAVVLALLFYAGPESFPPAARGAVAAVVFGAAAWLLVRIFRDRSGGLSMKLGGGRSRR